MSIHSLVDFGGWCYPDGNVSQSHGSDRMSFRDRIVEFRRIPAAQLVANPKNWRTHPRKQREALQTVMAEIGLVDAAIVRQVGDTYELIDGHLRSELMTDGDVPCLVLDVNDREADEVLLTLDPLAAMAGKSSDALRNLVAGVHETDSKLAELVSDLHRITIDPGTTGLELDEAPISPSEHLRDKWATEVGQVWIIRGRREHRLHCGDCLDNESVKRLMGDLRAGLMHTDPPYGVDYFNGDRPKGVRTPKPTIANDCLKDSELQSFLSSAFITAAHHALRDDAAWYVWHAELTSGLFASAAATAADVTLHRKIIWVKPVMLFGRGQYHWKHESCFFGWRKGHQPPDYGRGHGERDQTTVWEIGGVSREDRENFDHGTPKPVELFEIPIVKHLKQDEICYEPFAGTGPQFVAAEQLGRRCFGCELEPRYAAVILERMTNLGCECVLE